MLVVEASNKGPSLPHHIFTGFHSTNSSNMNTVKVLYDRGRRLLYLFDLDKNRLLQQLASTGIKTICYLDNMAT